jgi:hypothetical protein
MTAIVQSSFRSAETRRGEPRATPAVPGTPFRFPTGATGSYRELPGPKKCENPVPATVKLLSLPILQLLPPITGPTCIYLHQLAPTCRKKYFAKRDPFYLRVICVIRGPIFALLSVSIRVHPWLMLRSPLIGVHSRLPCRSFIAAAGPFAGAASPHFRIWRCPKPS